MSAVKVCHFCGKRSIDFSNVQNFFFHVKSHQSVPTNCCICDKTFKSKSALNDHKRTVHSEKVFCCDVCDKQFVSNTNLNKHKKIHTRTIKPENIGKGIFPCPECGKKFSYKRGMNDHIKKVHNFNQFSCILCDNALQCFQNS